VVMMLDIDMAKLREGMWKHLPFAAFIGIVIAAEMGAVLFNAFVNQPEAAAGNIGDTRELGKLIYTQYLYAFEIAAMILLAAMVAAVALTLRRRKDTKYFDPGLAVKTRRNDRIRIVSMAAESERANGNGDNAKPEGPIVTLTLAHFLTLGAILFAISVVGIFLNRKNVIILLMAIELMLLAVNMNFVAFSHYLGDAAGQIFVFFILTVAAAESAIGLAILVVLFRNLNTINVEDLDRLKG